MENKVQVVKKREVRNVVENIPLIEVSHVVIEIN